MLDQNNMAGKIFVFIFVFLVLTPKESKSVKFRNIV